MPGSLLKRVRDWERGEKKTKKQVVAWKPVEGQVKGMEPMLQRGQSRRGL
jgi:hypothetical protein